jgi:hypothetical protein
VPELVKTLEQLDEEKFPKLMAYPRGPISRRARINNHVERTNRTFRVLEQMRYKWRRRRTVVRFTVLTLDVIWREWTPAGAKDPERPKPTPCGKSQVPEDQRSRRVA